MLSRSLALRSSVRLFPPTAPQFAALAAKKPSQRFAITSAPSSWGGGLRCMASAPNPNYVSPDSEKKNKEPAAVVNPVETPKADASAAESSPAAEVADAPKQEEVASKAEAEAVDAKKETASDPPKKEPPKPDSKWKAIFKGTFFGCFMGGGYTALHVGLLGKAHLFEGLITGTLFVGPAVAGILADQYRAKVVFPYLLFTGTCWALFLYETDSSVWRVDRPQKWEKLKADDLAQLDEVVKKWNAGDLLSDHAALDKKFQLLKDPVSGVITPESLFMYFKMRTSEAKENALLIETVLISLMDASGDHSMTFLEFAKTVVLLYAMAEGSDEARVSACFKVLDSDKDGFISEEELAKWARFLVKNDLLDEEGVKNWGDSSAEEVAKKYLDAYDQDRDGKISYEEFTRLGPMIQLGAWMKEKGLAQWLITENSKDDDRIGEKTRVHVANIF